MKKTLVSIVTLVVVLFSFCVPSKAATITEASVWNNYTLFNTPILVDDSTSLQALYITDFGDSGFSFMMWSAFDMSGNGGDEIDFNLRKRWDIGKFSITAAVGYWNITDLETIDGDIGIESVTIAHKGFTPFGVTVAPSLMVRYHHDIGSHRFGEGFATVTKLDVSKTIKRVTMSVSPFVCYDTFVDFGTTAGFNADVAVSITKKTSVFAAMRWITDTKNNDASTFGVGIRSVF